MDEINDMPQGWDNDIPQGWDNDILHRWDTISWLLWSSQKTILFKQVIIVLNYDIYWVTKKCFVY